jgi:Tol biopolymer transport system component
LSDGPSAQEAATRGPITDAGMVMGTVGYMSPEQVLGQTADHRSDIFSFGALLYELLTGRRAFAADNGPETLTAILKHEPPDASTIGAPVPPALEQIVRRCLEKKPERRFQSAHDLVFALGMAASPSSATPAVSVAAASPRSGSSGTRERLAWIALTTVLALVAAGLAVLLLRPPAATAPPRVVTSALLPPPNTGLSSMAVSPDGQWIAFAAVTGGKTQLWVRPLESSAARALPGSEGATMPFWSPDSRSIGFAANGKLKRVAVTGGAAQTLADAGVFFGGTWSRDGVIVFSMAGFGLLRVAASGGEPTTILRYESANYQSPSFLPDGRRFLYTMIGARQDIDGVFIGSLDGTLKQRLLPAPSGAVYVDPGYLLFVRDGALLAQSFNAATLAFAGEPVTIAERVARNPNYLRDSFAVSETGLLVYDPIVNRQDKQLIWVDRTGQALGAARAVGGFSSPSLSPDETRVVVDRVKPDSDTHELWVQDLVGGRASRFTFDQSDNANPIWLADGGHIVWASNRDGRPYQLFVKPANGVGDERRWSSTDRITIATGRTTDSRSIISYEVDPRTKRDIWLRQLDGDGKSTLLVQTPGSDIGGPVSPDGRWLAYASDETGEYEIYVTSFPNAKGKWQLSANGGIGPSWRKDSRELFFYSREGQLMSVEITASASFTASAPRVLFEFRSGNGLTFVAPYAAAADGRRFLVNTIVDESNGAPLTLVVNWPELLKR